MTYRHDVAHKMSEYSVLQGLHEAASDSRHLSRCHLITVYCRCLHRWQTFTKWQ